MFSNAQKNLKLAREPWKQNEVVIVKVLSHLARNKKPPTACVEILGQDMLSWRSGRVGGNIPACCTRVETCRPWRDVIFVGSWAQKNQHRSCHIGFHLKSAQWVLGREQTGPGRHPKTSTIHLTFSTFPQPRTTLIP